MSIKRIQFSPIKERALVDQWTNSDSAHDDADEDPLANTDLTVKFQITDTQTIAHSYKRTWTLERIKEDIAGKFNVPLALLHILQDKKPVSSGTITLDDPETSLGSLNFNCSAILQANWT